VKKILALAFLFAASCGSTDTSPTVTIITASPYNGAKIQNDNNLLDGPMILLSVTNFTLIDPLLLKPDVAGQGHYHVYLDDATGGDYIDVGFTTIANAPIPIATTLGRHTIHLELVDNQDVAIGAVSNSWTITVEP
jgi:hypothetical protein